MGRGISALTSSLRRLLDEDDKTGTAFGGAGELPATAPQTAYNPSESERGFDAYIGDLVRTMQRRYRTPQDIGVGIIVSVARHYANEGRLPPFPSKRDPDEVAAEWVAAAMTTDFKTSVLRTAGDLDTAEVEAKRIGRR